MSGVWGADIVIPGDAIAGFTPDRASRTAQSCVLNTQFATALTTPFGRCQWHPFELQAKHFPLPLKGEGSKTPGRAGG